MFKAVVVGYDGSDPSVRALELACRLVKIHHAELHIVHTPENGMSEFAADQAASQEAQQAIRDAVEIAEAIGIAATSKTIGETEPCDDIMRIVDLYEGDLIVTGRRGLGGVTGLFLGSTSQKLAQVAKCACMTVT